MHKNEKGLEPSGTTVKGAAPVEPGVVSGPSRPKGETRRNALQAEPDRDSAPDYFVIFTGISICVM